MVDILDKERCCGCSACFNICPRECISMKEDEEGFLYPCVDKIQCIQCGLCEKVCVMQNEQAKADNPKAYAAYALDESIRAQSSSGGIFALLARYVIQKKGIVCGATFCSEDYAVKHVFVEETESIKGLMTSKYVQSDLTDCFKKVKQYLEKGRLLLFTGTPCQINGLKQYLGKEYDNLLCQDIVCHGVPSMKIWEMYLEHIAKKNNSEIAYESMPSFRDKAIGWKKYSISIPLKGGEYRNIHYKDSFLRGFTNNLCLRPSCYACHAKGLERSADITLADFWGIENSCPEMNDEMGVSLVMIYTHKGQEIWEEVISAVKCKEVKWEESIKYNPSASQSVSRPQKREYFFRKVNADNFTNIVNKCTRKSLKSRIGRKIRAFVGK